MENKMNNTNLVSALIKAQSEIEHAVKDATNPFFKSGYATLEAVIDAVKKPLNTNGIYFQQVSSNDAHGIGIETIFYGHGSEIKTGIVYVPAVKTDPQAFGSCLSYAKRYSLQMACGIASQDDDANEAMKHFQEKQNTPTNSSDSLE